MATIVAGTVLAAANGAEAATTYGHPSISYSGAGKPPTSDKPQSKLWWNDGSWWADMWTTGSGWHIYRLDRSSETWVDTGVLIDSRTNTLADTLWDGSHLYIASHVVTVSNENTPLPSIPGQYAYLYRYSYSGGQYTLDSGFPALIATNSSESMTIAQDTTGAIWATWTQVAGDPVAGFTNTVYVNKSAPGGTGWATPYIIPVSNPNPAPDDISAIVAYGTKKIGVMWSDQLTGSVWWATRTDGTDPTATSSWKVQTATKGNGLADDHLNLKSLQSDSSGRVFAAVKTSLDVTSTDPTLDQLVLLVFKPGTGSFSKSTISLTGDCTSRPQIVLDPENNLVHAFQTGPSSTVSGCAFDGVSGSIYEKTASMDNPVFAAGRGKPIMEDPNSPNINDVTTSKQPVSNKTGLVVMASDDVAKRYWFADRPLGVTPVPTAPGTFVPVTPIRLLDTRNTAPVGAFSTVSFQAAGVAGIPSKVSAVVFNLTVTQPQAYGHIIAYASGTTRPTTSNENFVPGQTVPNSVTVPVGADGKVTLVNNSGGTTHLIADIAGYYIAGTPAVPGAFVPVSPTRLLDTRNTAPAGAFSSVSFQAAGVAGIPANVSAVVFNLTVTQPQSYGHIIAYASGTTRPTTSNENFVPGQTVPNSVTVPVGSDGKITLVNNSNGTTHVIADIGGYYIAGTPAVPGAFVPVSPTRLLDTRNTAPAGAFSSVSFQAAGVAGIPLKVSAIVFNLTVTQPQSYGHITAYASGTTRPSTSNENFVPGQTVPNSVTVPVGSDGKIVLVNNSSGTTHLIADVAGYFLSGTP
ncbi:hypothetical protein QK290_01020 [Pseudarthrobacter sp. AL07]|uniref:hypothetical protein n=1 Tax=Pseudarthrobacter sp. AL20 TaxID=3042239 RepID=UPI00249C4BC2|nr:hypothetical protein [Pseudarthrobacter sp. AL20]MDI3193051.1 hypothetical protein [Pseudarthrobacter sp. AL20]MDI3207130.1 hypothetical protein [Pseudarthrobacter sp. AL07]